MYYKDRVEAGRKLAEKLQAYKSKNCVVVALSESSVLVAAQVAMELHANLLLYLVRDIMLPGEDEAVAAISSTGAFRYNDALSHGEIDEISGEFRNHIEQERFGKTHEMNALLGSDGEIDKNLLRHRNVILVADALPDGFALTMAYEFLKTVATKRIIVAAPVVSVPAIDKMHVIADELHVGGVTANFLSIDHYYDENHELDSEEIMKILRNISMTWHDGMRPGHAQHHHQGNHSTKVLSRRHVRRRV